MAAKIFLQHIDGVTGLAKVEAVTITEVTNEPYKVQLENPPQLALVLDETKPRTKYKVVPDIDEEPDRVRVFLVTEREQKDLATSTLRVINYDPRYYLNDVDHPDESYPPAVGEGDNPEGGYGGGGVVGDPPTFTSLSDTQINAGSQVTVTGSHFTDTIRVVFADWVNCSFEVSSDTILLVYPPMEGVGTLKIVTPYGEVATDTLTVLPSGGGGE